MEDFFDSFIYILIVVVGFVISALGKKKKKAAPKMMSDNQQPQQTQPKERPFLSNLEKLLNEELGITGNSYENTYEREIQTEDPEPVLDSPVSRIDNTSNILDSVPEKNLNEIIDTPYDSIEYSESDEIFKGSIKDDEIRDKEENKILDDFDLEQAIIYSEILNRKEN